MTLLSILAIGAALTVGYYLYVHYSGGADAAYDAIATGSAILWVLAGIFTVIGGFVLFGSLLIIVFSYIGFTKGEKTNQRLRSRIAG